MKQIISILMAGIMIAGFFLAITPDVKAAPSLNEIRVDSDVALALEANNGDGTLGNPWVIENRVISGYGQSCGIYIGNTTDYFVIRNCTINATTANYDEWHTGAGIHIYNCDNGEISNTTVNHSISYGIYLSDQTTTIVIANNSIWNCTLRAIAVSYSDNCLFYMNDLDGNYTSNFGMSFDGYSDFHVIEKNTIDGMNWVGIGCNDTWNMSITDNEITGFNYTLGPDTWYGPYVGIFMWNSEFILASDNRVTNCTVGMNFTSTSANSLVWDNIVSADTTNPANTAGIMVYDITNITFWNNTVVFFDFNALDPLGEGTWNNAAMGNRWGDYTGSDTDGNGIGETPYLFTNNVDNLPLCIPYTTPVIVPGGGIPYVYTPIIPAVTDDGPDTTFDFTLTWLFWVGIAALIIGMFKIPIPYIGKFIIPHMWVIIGICAILLNFVW